MEEVNGSNPFRSTKILRLIRLTTFIDKLSVKMKDWVGHTVIHDKHGAYRDAGTDLDAQDCRLAHLQRAGKPLSAD